jgi:anti-sigma B factor antagonist
MSEVSAVSRLPTPDPIPTSRFVCTWAPSSAHAAWVHVEGELDLATSPELEHELQDARVGARLVVIDLRGVTFIDCSGLHALLAADVGEARTILVTGHAVSRLLELAGVADQVSTVDLDPSEPDPALGLVPKNAEASSARPGEMPTTAQPYRKAS